MHQDGKRLLPFLEGSRVGRGGMGNRGYGS